MKYAFILNGQVTDIESRTILLEQLYHKNLLKFFTPIPPNQVVKIGYLYRNGEFVAPN